MNKKDGAQIRRDPDDWDGSSVHSLAKLKDTLARYMAATDDVTEFAVGGSQPLVIRQTEVDGILVELSAKQAKQSLDPHNPRSGELKRTDQEERVHQLKKIFSDLDAPAITTKEVVSRMNCPPHEVERHLTEFENNGWISSQKSGDATLWWANEDTEILSVSEGSSQSPPKYVAEALEQSRNDINEWVATRQREGESTEETRRRIQGNPTFEDLKKLLLSESSKHDEMMAYISEKRESDKQRKDDLVNLFE